MDANVLGFPFVNSATAVQAPSHKRGQQAGEGIRPAFSDKNTGTLSRAPIGVNCAQACEEFP